MTRPKVNFRNTLLSFLLCASVSAHADVPSLDAARSALSQGRADEALLTLNQTLAQQPQNAEALNLRCRVFLQEQRWENAISSCQSAVHQQPGNSDYHLWLARALGEKADRVNFIVAFKMAKQVHQEFETAAKLDPKNAAALSDLAEFYIDAPAIVGGGLDKAGSVAQQLDAAAPERAHYIRARIAEEQKNYPVAEQEFKAAVAGSKEPAGAWMDLASFYYRRQNWQAMIAAVHSGASADQENGVALADGASLLTRANRELPFARQLMESYLASSNKSEDAPAFQVHMRLGKLLAQLGDPEGANQQYAAAHLLAKDYQAGSRAATNSGR